MAADAHGRSRWTYAVSRFPPQEGLDYAVLQGVIADNDKPASKAEQAVGLD